MVIMALYEKRNTRYYEVQTLIEFNKRNTIKNDPDRKLMALSLRDSIDGIVGIRPRHPFPCPLDALGGDGCGVIGIDGHSSDP